MKVYSDESKETITAWQVRMYRSLVNIVDLPNLSTDVIKWTCEQRNRFEDLMHFAYDNFIDEISWNDDRVEDRPCIKKLTTF